MQTRSPLRVSLRIDRQLFAGKPRLKLPQFVERQIVEPARHLKTYRLRSAAESTISHERGSVDAARPGAPRGSSIALTSTTIARSPTGPMVLTASIVRLFSELGLRPPPALRQDFIPGFDFR
jgi:hypothetical protein